ncbi:MAG: transporter substrate-binding protein [Rhodobacteraceae bacterium]|nr:transporter substrate-binding protein [Paracoccaceae bacterium]
MSLRLGLIFSTTGSYAALGQSALAGALGAIETLQKAGAPEITPVIADPGGDIAEYERLTRSLLDDGVRHILGAITSSSRKEMIPLLEQRGGLLWYPCPYEGFESNDHVVYLGAAPNHHVVPVTDWIAAQGMRRAFLVGSNYVWGWETLRLARDCLQTHGVKIVGERYVPLGSTRHDHVLDEVCSRDVECVVDSLIGPSNTTFLQGLAARDPARVGRPGHVVSFNQTEADLDDLGAAANGLLSAGSLFEEDAGAQLKTAARRHAPNGRVSSFLSTAYAAVEIIAEALVRAGTEDPKAMFKSACSAPVATAMGPVSIDPVLRHAELRPCLSLAEDGHFRVVERMDRPIPADPYLTSRVANPIHRKPVLRIIQ